MSSISAGDVIAAAKMQGESYLGLGTHCAVGLEKVKSPLAKVLPGWAAETTDSHGFLCNCLPRGTLHYPGLSR